MQRKYVYVWMCLCSSKATSCKIHTHTYREITDTSNLSCLISNRYKRNSTGVDHYSGMGHGGRGFLPDRHLQYHHQDSCLPKSTRTFSFMYCRISNVVRLNVDRYKDLLFFVRVECTVYIPIRLYL